MERQVNKFKEGLQNGQPQIGLWLSLCSNTVAELVGYSGYDWLLLDSEHAPNEPAAMLTQLQGMATGTASAVVRPAWNDAVMIKRFLDIGAQSFLVPYVETAEEAAAAVAAVRYPPRGMRGVATSTRANRFARVKDYFNHADDEICMLVQVETQKGYDNLDSILATDGVDGVFVGPSDLSAGLGHLGNPGHPDVQAAIIDINERCKAAGKPAGILAPVEEDAKRYLDAGFMFVAVGADIGLLIKHSDALLKRFKPG
ncbi:MAG: HpcH/HpaI aldolase/citrate lyase family protein [Alphaproteobacteria bacterium]|mgnify:FL=1|nr:HpcH/HpaI aldolase/citrate lyase family protein [Alphaproteobacteria bacterium]MBT4086272.1 HpcH/HpaI aldolase/citrate lyase family protein [Alphaproteobacteria bacterium]MBT4543889.1 HpcH/HpaI aldolase/citrate lyase family protein [Alphaproteobacteria bacterium]MBT6387611.1 HpcH/HpaI aldolase/citrate lyase family protein [Alphaproteobacteria bacterium]MBT7745258.1 HpcH/HpaI aldolase/citrate lyase family protein [Alphaproteobacteria bacterium]